MSEQQIDGYRGKPVKNCAAIAVNDRAPADDSVRARDRTPSSKDELQRVGKAIVQLPKTCQQAFILNRFYGYSHEQVANHMGVSIKTVGKHIAAALKACHQSVSQRSS